MEGAPVPDSSNDQEEAGDEEESDNADEYVNAGEEDDVISELSGYTNTDTDDYSDNE